MIAAKSVRLTCVGLYFLSALLCGCGGDGTGGSAAPATVPASSVSVPASYAAFLSSPHSTSFTVSGDCTGSATWTSGTPTATTFEGSPALAVTQTRTRTLSGCTLASAQTIRTFYFNSSYGELGLDVQGGYYGVAAVPLAVQPANGDLIVSGGGITATVTLPASAQPVVTTTTPATPSTPATTTSSVSLQLGTLQLYADSSKTVNAGTLVESMTAEVSGGAALTIGATLVKQVFDSSGALNETETETYQISPSGVMTLTAVDIQYAGSNGNGHLVFTAQ